MILISTCSFRGSLSRSKKQIIGLPIKEFERLETKEKVQIMTQHELQDFNLFLVPPCFLYWYVTFLWVREKLMPDNNQPPQQLKALFNNIVVEQIADRVKDVWEPFDRASFIKNSMEGFDSLTLKQRSAKIADTLYQDLNLDFEQSIKLLLQAMRNDNGTGGLEGYTDFAYLPFLDVVERHGLGFPKVALDALEHMTLFFSAEFAVRPYILRYPELTMEYLHRWAGHSEWRVRRLASEGSRPRLPWGIQLKPFVNDPSAVLAILDKLYEDENLTVRRSVANHLNDIAKDHPDSVVETANRWWLSNNKSAQWTVKHGLRTLVKQGNAGALAVLGFNGGEHVDVHDFTLSSDKVRMGEEVVFQCCLHSHESEASRLVVDYALERPLANDKTTKKVFKLRTLVLEPEQSVCLTAKHAFRQLSTRTYYPGAYAIEIMINGQVTAVKRFEVISL